MILQVNSQTAPDALIKILSQFLSQFPPFSTDWVPTMMSDIKTTSGKDIDDAKKSILDGIKKRHEEASKCLKNMSTMNEMQKRNAQQKLDERLNNITIRLDSQSAQLMGVIDRILEVLYSYLNRVDNNRKVLIDTVTREANNINFKVSNLLTRASTTINNFQRRLDRK